MKKFSFVFVMFTFIAGLYAIKLPEGTDTRLKDIVKDNGIIIEAELSNPSILNTPVGKIRAEGRVSFFKNGNVKSVFLGTDESKNVHTLTMPCGSIKIIGKLSFYENGNIRTVELSESQTVETPLGNFKVHKSMEFYEDGKILSLVPGENLRFKASIGLLDISIEEPLEFYENGTIQKLSLEKSAEITTVVGICNVSGSIDFYENGIVRDIKLSQNEVVRINGTELTITDSVSFYEDGKLNSVITAKQALLDRLLFGINEKICFEKDGSVIDRALPLQKLAAVIPKNHRVTVEETEKSEVFCRNRTVTITSFELQNGELTYYQWKNIYDWALKKGYSFISTGREGSEGIDGEEAKSRIMPVTSITWRDAITWCNAFSEYSRFTPCYYDKSTQQVIRDAEKIDFEGVLMDLSKDGYRLPTEAEWEFAARGGNQKNRENWNYEFAGSDDILEVCWFNENSFASEECGLLKANLLGLYDMSGNIWEWCFDLYGEIPLDSEQNPKGPDTGTMRVLRGGAWSVDQNSCHVYDRDYAPDGRYNNVGFRLARSL